MEIELSHLGQAGIRIKLPECVLYTDPYLSNAVEELYGPTFRRQTPPPIEPSEIRDASYVLISHDHEDHCDPKTLLPLLKASPTASVFAPPSAIPILSTLGIDSNRIIAAPMEWLDIDHNTKIKAVPAAHPEIEYNEVGHPKQVGYLLKFNKYTLYFAGDTSPHPTLLKELKKEALFDIAFLPVNERNYFLTERGIVGNMTIKEAFEFAETIKARILIPIHWDMFQMNSVDPDIIRTTYKAGNYSFAMYIKPEKVHIG